MDVYTLANASGSEVRFMELGGIIVSIRVPDRNGVLAEVTAGYDTLGEYERDGAFFGALIGRYANRIAGARFRLDGGEYALSRNDGANHLHGGFAGFHKLIWRVAPFRRADACGAVLCCRSAAGDQGYPGTLLTRVTYTLTDDDAFTIDYDAITDAPTPVSLTQHTYFNLAGRYSGDILGHELTIDAAEYTPVGADLTPTGELRAVRGTAFDFTEPRPIGAALAAGDEQLEVASGFDHNFVLRGGGAEGDDPPRFAARLYEPASGRALDVFTTEPGLQFYSGNGLDRGPSSTSGQTYARYGALALETQHFPDSPNQPSFPSTILRPNEEYRSRTVWRFSTQPKGDPSRRSG